MIATRDYKLPSNAGVINVKTQYNAVGDGVADDTAAIKAAMLESCAKQYHLLFPIGTYLVSDQLRAVKSAVSATTGQPLPSDHLKIYGENRDQTFIKLKPNAAGFQDPANPKPVIYYQSSSASTKLATWESLGEGNEAYGNYMEHITVLTSGNVGATGVDYLASNGGAIRDCVIDAGSTRAGVAGISMMRNWPGPALIKDVRIVGFDYAARLGIAQYSMTLEHIEIENQKVIGLYNFKNLMNVRGLKSVNSVPAVKNDSSQGMICLIDADLTGGASNQNAIDNTTGEILARNVTTSGYANALINKGTVVPGANITEFGSRGVAKLFNEAPDLTLNLPVQEPPVDFHDNDLSTWANVADYGAVASGGSVDAGPGVQAAMNSGKATVYFPTNSYYTAQTIVPPSSVKRIAGMGSQLLTKANSGWTDPNNPKTALQVDNPNALQIDRLRIARNVELSPGLVPLEQRGAGSLYLKDVTLISREYVQPGLKSGGANPGVCFLENVVATRVSFPVKGQKVFARQLNIETTEKKLDLDGSIMWVFGFKTEGRGTAASLINQAKLEFLGGFLFPTTAPPAGTPAFLCDYSTMSLNYKENVTTSGANYPIHVIETSYAGGITATRQLLRSSANVVPNGFGSLVNLFASANNGDNPPPAQYAIVYPEPLDVEFGRVSAVVTYRVQFGSPDKIDFSTIKVTLSAGDTQDVTLSNIQAALVAEATRLNMTIIPANMLLPSLAKGK